MDLSMILSRAEEDKPQTAVKTEPLPLPVRSAQVQRSGTSGGRSLQDLQMILNIPELQKDEALVIAPHDQDSMLPRTDRPVLMEVDGEYQRSPLSLSPVFASQSTSTMHHDTTQCRKTHPAASNLCLAERLPPMKTAPSVVARRRTLPARASTHAPRLSFPLPVRHSGSGAFILQQRQKDLTRSRRIGATPISKTKVPWHSNVPYTVEEVFYFRYRKEDCGKQYKDIVAELPRFGGPPRDSGQCSSARLYREDLEPTIDVHGSLVLDSMGKVVVKKCLRRDRKLQPPESAGPVLLVERNPRWAVLYDWVAPEHKARAQAILDGTDRAYYHSYKDKMRRAIEKWEDTISKMQSGFLALQPGQGAYPSPASSTWSGASPLPQYRSRL